MKFKIFIYLAALALSVSCSQQDKMEIVESASAFDLAQAKAAIKQSGLTLANAFEENDTATIMNAYTKDANVLPTRHEALEEDSIRYYVVQLLNSNVEAIGIESKGVWGDSTLVAEVGTYSLEGNDNEQLDEGKYILLWKRESGNWKIYRQMWTSDLRENKVVFNMQNKNKATKN